MPLVKRLVEPSALCRSLDPAVNGELEYVTNKTLSGVILQLSSLSLHAEDIFSELFTEATSFYSRANVLQDRIDRLSVKVTQLDATVEEVSLHDINKKTSFKSNPETDQQVVSRESLPKMLHETYNKADKPPPLQELNRFRDDNRDALKIYTDPDYFFNLWREAMQKEMRDAKEKRRELRKKEKRANPNYRKPHKIREAVATRKIEAKKKQMGKEFEAEHAAEVDRQRQLLEAAGNSKPKIQSSDTASSGIASHSSSHDVIQTDSSHPSTPVYHHHQQHEDVADIPPPYTTVEQQQQQQGFVPPPPQLTNIPLPPPLSNGSMTSPPHRHMETATPRPPSPVCDMQFPPPAPPAPALPSNIPAPPPVPSSGGVPPPPPPPAVGIPPPPPPPPVSATAAPSGGAGGFAGDLMNVRLKKAVVEPKPVEDERSGLLQAIRKGINLKKVEKLEKTEHPTSTGGGNDVASILARRIAVEFSDSECDSSDYDSEWDD